MLKTCHVGEADKCPKCLLLQRRIESLSREDLIKVMLSNPPEEKVVDEVLNKVDIDELLLMLVNMAEEPCESDKDFRELVRKNAQVAYNLRNRYNTK